MVTSAGPSEGKTTIAANLAGIIAQGGQRVVLMDADLRRPAVHTFFRIPNRLGLTNIFRDNLDVNNVVRYSKDVKGFGLITSGVLPPNPAELLASEKMDSILASLKEIADVVVIDCPPSLVADVQVLSARVDCVLLVIQPGSTNRDAAVATMEQFRRAGARVVGAVLNRIPRHRSYAYGGYSYQSSYYYASEPKAAVQNPRRSGNGRTAHAAATEARNEPITQPKERPDHQEPASVPNGDQPAIQLPESGWPMQPLPLARKKPGED